MTLEANYDNMITLDTLLIIKIKFYIDHEFAIEVFELYKFSYFCRFEHYLGQTIKLDSNTRPTFKIYDCKNKKQ